MSQVDPQPNGLIIKVISCARSPESRRRSAAAQIESLKVAAQVEIVDGYTADDAIVDALYTPSLNRWRSKRPVARTEIAVYASHRLALQQMIDSGHQAALVLEDDFALGDTDKVLAAIEHWSDLLGDGRDVVKLFDFEKRSRNRVHQARNVAGIELVKWRAPTAGMVAYLISREGGQKLLARERIYRQIDEDTKYFWELGLDIWSIPGNPILEVSTSIGGSLVETDREQIKQRKLSRSLWGMLLTVERKLKTWFYLLRPSKPQR